MNRLQCTDCKRQGDYEWFGPKELTVIRNGQVIVMDREWAMQTDRKSFGTLKSDRYIQVTVMGEWRLLL